MTRTLRLAAAAALLLAACLAAAPAAAAEQPAAGSSGFDALAGLLAKIQANIDTTHKITAAKYEKDLARCNATLAPVQKEVDDRQQVLIDAHARAQNASDTERALAEEFGPLNKRLAAAQLEMDRMAKRAREGDKDREEEAHLVQVKLADTARIVEVVDKLAAKLTQVNVTQFSFRAVLERASAGVEDRQLSGMLADAAAATKKSKTVVKASDETTVLRLRKLMGLLTTELEQYRDTVGRHEQEAAADWKEHRAHLQQRVDELFKEIKAVTEAKDRLRERVAEQKKVQEEARAVIDGPVNAQLDTWKARRDLIAAHCDLKRKHFAAEEQARRGQSETLDALSKLTVQHADSGYDLGIGGIPVPRPSSCCVKCSGDRPSACGDKCVPASEWSTSTCGVGCACSAGDPRLVVDAPNSGSKPQQ